MSIQLVLLRHGQSVYNVEQRFAGSSDVALTPLGVQQAQAAGVLLRDQGFEFDLVYTSELQRARITAQEVLQRLVNSPDPARTWRLNERHFGELEGMRFVEAAETYGPDWGQPWLWGKRPPGGEAMEDVAARIEPWLQDELLPAARAGKRVLVVSHGNTMRVLDELLRGSLGERLKTIPTATPLLYSMSLEDLKWAVLERRYLLANVVG